MTKWIRYLPSAIIARFGARLLGRLSWPYPTIPGAQPNGTANRRIAS
jgi:hypothetical protein